MAKAVKAALTAAVVVFLVVTGLGYLDIAVQGVMTIGSLGTAASMAVLTFGTTLLTAAIGGMTSKGMNATGGNFGSKFAARAATAQRQLVYGECRVGGTIVHMETTGTDNYLLHMVVVIAGHEIQSLESVRLNDVTLTTTTSTISGSTVHTVTNSDFSNTDNENKYDSNGRLIRFSFQNGSQTAADGYAVAQSSLASTDKFLSCAYVYIQMVFDPEKFGGGQPNVSFLVKGKKVFDPRDNSTAWSNNPALCVRDFISNTQYGLKALTSEINDTTNAGGFATAANACEVDVTLADNSTTEDKYTANGFTNFGASGTGILEGLLSSMAGKMSYVNGQFNIFAGTTQTPSLTITDDDVLSPINVTTNPTTGELYNTVKPIYVDASNNYIAADAPVYQDSTFLTEDTPNGVTNDKPNYVKQMENQLPFTTTHTMAQRIGRLALKAQRQTTVLNCLVSLEFMKLQPADWVYVTNERLGYSQKIFEVSSVNLEVMGDEVPILGVRLGLKETASSVYTFATSDYNANIAAGSNLASGGFAVAAPTSLSVATDSTTNDNLGTTSVTATWVNSASPTVIFTDVQFKRNGAADATYTSTTASKGSTKQTILGLEIGVTYNFRVRHAGVGGSFSAFSSVVNHTVAGTAQSLANYLNSNVTTTKTFFQNDVPTALSAGDLWIDSNDGNKIYRAHAAGADQVTANEWILTTITAGAIGLGSVLNQAQVTTFAQDGVPTATAIGDLWIDTNDGNKIYRAQSAGANQVTGGEWVVTTLTKAGIGLGNVADERQITIFRQDAVPTATAVGDLWYDTDNNNKQYRATAAGNNAVAANQWIEVTPDKTAVGLSEVDNTSDATTMAGTLTGQINDGTTNFTAAELLKIRAGFDGLDGTAVLKTLNANTALRNGEISLAADGTLTGAGTSVQVNLDSIPDAGNTKTHASYAGTGLDSNGRVKVGIISGGVVVTVADIKDAKVRAFAGFDASGNVNRPVPSAQIAGAMEDSLTASPSEIAIWTSSDGAYYSPSNTTQDVTVTYYNGISSDECVIRWTISLVAYSTADFITSVAEQTDSNNKFTIGSISPSSATNRKSASVVVTHTASSATITLQALVSIVGVAGGGK